VDELFLLVFLAGRFAFRTFVAVIFPSYLQNYVDKNFRRSGEVYKKYFFRWNKQSRGADLQRSAEVICVKRK
jgi:hypothetical protein